MSKLTPEQRSMRARLAAYKLHATHDPTETTAAARAAGPASLAYFLKQIDPESALPDATRTRRAEAARRAYFTRLALASSIARRRRQAQTSALAGRVPR